jgi:endonuclease III
MAKKASGGLSALSAEALDALRGKALEVYRILLDTYGERPHIPRRDPMHELISTILSHRTTGANEKQAYDNMWRRFGSWDAIRDAPLDELIEALSPATFPDVKAPYIKNVLAAIYERRGEYNIDFLRDTPTDEALAWLMSMPGVGIKTATLVLLFCFAKPVMPVDTHVHRVSQRIGFIGAKVDPTAAHPLLLNLLPPDPYVLYNFHIANLKHGQQICVWGTPKCEKCPLTHLCNYYQTVRKKA